MSAAMAYFFSSLIDLVSTMLAIITCGMCAGFGLGTGFFIARRLFNKPEELTIMVNDERGLR